MITLKCRHCGKEFQNKNPNTAHCSDECKKIASKIATFNKRSPKEFEGIKNKSNMARQIVEGGDRW